MLFRLQVCLLCFVSTQILAGDIALIIDDMGNHQRDAAAFALPVEVTFAILPHTALSSPYSKRAAAQQREVMLHVPMESLSGKRLGAGAVLSNMTPEQVDSVLQSALKTVPDAIGINNHMGSKLTQLTLPMTATMEFLQQRNMFFVDSRTTRYSKAGKIAAKKGVLHTRRDVFLDHSVQYDDIHEQFQRLLQLANKQGYAVGIAHPYPESIDYLQKHLGLLSEQGFRLVPLSEIIQLQQKLGLDHTDLSAKQAPK